jgi:hypothetical protein
MDKVMVILFFSVTMWILIDRAKVMWQDLSYGKYITTAVAMALGFVLSFGYNLDVIYALDVVTEPSILGKILTGIALTGGSSGVSEIVSFFKKQ